MADPLNTEEPEKAEISEEEAPSTENPDSPGADPEDLGSEEESSFLEMSDEDFIEKSDDIESQIEEQEEDPEDPEKAEEPVNPEGAEAAAKPADTEEPAKTEPAKAVEEPAPSEAKTEPSTKEAAPPAKEAPKQPEKQSATDPLQANQEEAVAAYQEIFKPFRANGKTVQAKTPAEVIRLMQMGAGYTKTLMDLKPKLALIKTLDNNGISADDLNYFVELKQGNPDAIKKLVRDAKIDPLDIDTGDAGKTADAAYRPKDYSASETQVNFELALADVSSFPEGKEILESVRNDWDSTSRSLVYEDPSILRVLTEQKQDGIYDQIAAQVDHERMLGNLNGVPFLQAYQAVGQAMTQQGLLRAPKAQAPVIMENKTETPTPSQAVVQEEVLDRKAAPAKSAVKEDPRAKAVAPVKTGAAPKGLPANPLEMSDEEFAKLEGLESFV